MGHLFPPLPFHFSTRPGYLNSQLNLRRGKKKNNPTQQTPTCWDLRADLFCSQIGIGGEPGSSWLRAPLEAAGWAEGQRGRGTRGTQLRGGYKFFTFFSSIKIEIKLHRGKKKKRRRRRRRRRKKKKPRLHLCTEGIGYANMEGVSWQIQLSTVWLIKSSLKSLPM